MKICHNDSNYLSTGTVSVDNWSRPIFVILVRLYMKTVSLYHSLNDFLARQINETTDGSFVQDDFHRGIMCGP